MEGAGDGEGGNGGGLGGGFGGGGTVGGEGLKGGGAGGEGGPDGEGGVGGGAGGVGGEGGCGGGDGCGGGGEIKRVFSSSAACIKRVQPAVLPAATVATMIAPTIPKRIVMGRSCSTSPTVAFVLMLPRSFLKAGAKSRC